MGTDKIKPRHLDENFKLPLDKLEKMPTANEVGALSNTTKATDIGGASAEVVENLSDELEEVKKSVSDGKTEVATAITAKGVTTATDAEFATMASNIESITTINDVTQKVAATITPGTSNQTIAAGTYLTGAQTILGDADLVSANIKSGANIFGVAGNSNVVDTSAGTATAAQILSGQTAYVDGAKITGTMTNRGAVSQTLTANGTYTIPAGYHNGSGKVTQSLTTKAATTYTPTTSNQTIAAGTYCSGAQTIKGDANLVASNIKKGVTIFGVTGTASTVTSGNTSKTWSLSSYADNDASGIDNLSLSAYTPSSTVVSGLQSINFSGTWTGKDPSWSSSRASYTCTVDTTKATNTVSDGIYTVSVSITAKSTYSGTNTYSYNLTYNINTGALTIPACIRSISGSITLTFNYISYS